MGLRICSLFSVGYLMNLLYESGAFFQKRIPKQMIIWYNS